MCWCSRPSVDIAVASEQVVTIAITTTTSMRAVMVKVDIIIPTDQEMNKTLFHSTSQAVAITTRTEAGMKHIGVGMAGTGWRLMMRIPGRIRKARPPLQGRRGPRVKAVRMTLPPRTQPRETTPWKK